MRSFVVLSLAASLTLALPATRAFAAEPVTDPAVADVVETRDGIVVRGLILERDPSGSVVIRSAMGALRTFKMSDVVYAGPADRSSQTIPAPVVPRPVPVPVPVPDAAPRPRVVEGETVRVELESGTPDVSFHLRNATAFAGSHAAVGYTPLCSAPCSANLPRGVVNLAVADGNGLPREGSEVLRIEGPSRVRADFVSSTGRRVLGGAMLAGAVLVGLNASSWSEREEQSCVLGTCTKRLSTNGTILSLSILAGTVLAVGGGSLLFGPPSIKITVTPLVIAPTPGLGPDVRRVFAPNGAALEVQF